VRVLPVVAGDGFVQQNVFHLEVEVDQAAKVRVCEAAQQLASCQLQAFFGHGTVAVDVDTVVEQLAAVRQFHDHVKSAVGFRVEGIEGLEDVAVASGLHGYHLLLHFRTRAVVFLFKNLHGPPLSADVAIRKRFAAEKHAPFCAVRVVGYSTLQHILAVKQTVLMRHGVRLL